MTWEKLKPLTDEEAGLRSNCLNCGPQPICFPRDGIIAVGFGDAGVTKDGVEIWSEAASHTEPFWNGEDAENAAKQDPDHDWRIYFEGPLSNAVYQRQGDDWWVLVEKGPGFA